MSRQGEHREPFSCSASKAGACLEGKEPPPALRGEVPACPLARGRVRPPSGGQSLSPSPSLQQRQGRHPFLSVPSWVTGRDHNLRFSSPTSSCWTFGSWLLRRRGHRHFLYLELAAELWGTRESSLPLLFVTICQATGGTTGAGVRAGTNHTYQQAFVFGGGFQELSSLLHPGPSWDTGVPPTMVGSSCLQRQLPTGWQRAGISLPSTVSLTQGELWKGCSHCQSVIPFLAPFDFHFLFSCSSCESPSATPSHASTPCFLHAMLPGTGCISSSACPSYRKDLISGAWKMGEGGSVLRPSLHLHCIYKMSWYLLAATRLLQMPWPSSSVGHVLHDGRSPCLPFGVCRCILFLFPLRSFLWSNWLVWLVLKVVDTPVGAFQSSSISSAV